VEQVPGLVFRRHGGIVANPRQARAEDFGEPFARDRGFAHALAATGIPVRLGRGCNQGCSYCVEPQIEGRACRFRDPFDVIQELQLLAEAHPEAQKAFFVDAELNVPGPEPARELLGYLVKSGMADRFRFASQFLPTHFDPGLAESLAAANFAVVLTCDSFSDAVLGANGMSYAAAQGVEVIRRCADLGVPLTVNLVFGLPGETEATLSETFKVLADFPPGPLRSYEYTVGGRIYPGTRLARMAREGDQRHIHGAPSADLLEPVFSCAPLPPDALGELIASALGLEIGWSDGRDPLRQAALGLVYLADRGRGREALGRLQGAPDALLCQAYDPLFRRLGESGEIESAAALCQEVLARIRAGSAELAGLADLAMFHLGLLDRRGCQAPVK